MSSPLTVPSAVERWINPETNLPSFTRQNAETLERRTVAAAELYEEGYYKTITAASKALKVPYSRLYSRLRGAHPRSLNGGNRALLRDEEEREMLAWVHRRTAQGHRIQLLALQHQANEILAARGETTKVSRSWAKRFKRRTKKNFHITIGATSGKADVPKAPEAPEAPKTP